LVLALLALTLAIVIPDLRRSDRVQYDAELRSAAALLRQARRLAIVQGVETSVLLESAAAVDRAAAREAAGLQWHAATLQLAFQGVGEEDYTMTERVELLFRPQGSSGGTVHFFGEDYHGQIRVDPINGRAEAV